MAETANIAAMAERLSNELFAEFFWKPTGPMNENWACEKPEVHNVKTHPSDIVFYYDEPYTRQRTYVNCDLKSYARSSIAASALKGSLESLAKQVACAEISEEWRAKYIHSGVTPAICGLLFVYNHDGEYDQDFHSTLNALKDVKLDLPRGSKVVVLGPEDIGWLDNVRYEIVQMRGRRTSGEPLPEPEHCKFFYPHLVRRKNLQLDRAKAATLEMLTSKLIAMEYVRPTTPDRQGVVLFYRGKGASADEFTYLLDYLRNFQLLQEHVDVELKHYDASSLSSVNFQKAAQSYVDGLAHGGAQSPLAECVNRIQYKRIPQVVTRFSNIELGMDYE